MPSMIPIHSTMMPRWLCCGALLLFFTGGALAQLTDSSIQVIAYWPQNGSLDYELARSRLQVKDGDTTQQREVQSAFSLRVADSSEQRYTLHWKYQPNALLGEAAALMGQDLLSGADSLVYEPITYFTFPEGDFEKLQDWEALRDRYQALLQQVMTPILEGKMGDQATRARMRGIMAQLEEVSMANANAFQQYYLKELSLYHNLYGVEVPLSDTVLYEEAFPNPLGGEPLQGLGKIYVGRLDPNAQRCTIVMETSVDPEQVKAMTEQMLARLMEGNASEDQLTEMRAALAGFSMEVLDRVVYTFDLDLFWVVEADYVRRTRLETGNGETGLRIDQVHFRQVE